MNISKIKQGFSVTWCHVLAFILIVTTGGAWFNDTSLLLEYDSMWKLLCMLSICGSIAFLLFGNRPVLSDKVIGKTVIVTACAFTYKYASEADVGRYDYFFLIMLLWIIGALLLLEKPQNVWRAYVNITIVLAAISLFFYLFGTILHLIPETGVTAINWGVWDTSSVRTFWNLYYEAQGMKLTDTVRIMRNCGIFSEAPMYNFVLCTALGAELFLQEHPHGWKCIVFAITIISTLSTTGLLFLVLAGGLYFVEYAYRKNIIAAHKKIFGTILFIGVVAFLGIIWTKTFSPSGSGSMSVRTDHLLACIKAWLANPMHGCGFLNLQEVLYFAKYKQGISVGLPYLLACGGIVLGLVLLFPYFINVIEAIKIKEFKEVCFETLFLMLYFFTAVTDTPVFLFFIAYITVYNSGGRKR